MLNGKTPFEVLYGKPLPLPHLRTFGCLCYAHNKGRQGDKFAPKGKQCIFIGYPYGKKGWKVFDLETKESYVSRDIHFIENVFPFSQPHIEDKDNAWNLPHLTKISHEDEDGFYYGRSFEVGGGGMIPLTQLLRPRMMCPHPLNFPTQHL